jgi:hypothetical protein
MSRAYTCQRCHRPRATDSKRGPLPKLCDPCKLKVAEEAEAVPRETMTLPSARQHAADVAVRNEQARQHAVENDPDSRAYLTAANAPEPLPAQPPPPLPPYEPGFLETTLRAELEAMTSTNPAAKTLAASAMAIARAADMADPSDLKQVLAANKELRSTIEAITKYQGGDDDEQSLFGAVQAEVVNPAAV